MHWFGSKRCAGNKLSWYEGHWFGYIAIDSQKRTQEIVYFSAGKQTHAQNWACENIKRDLYPQTCRFLGIFEKSGAIYPQAAAETLRVDEKYPQA